MKVSLLNHASVLIEVDNIKLLTDPWFEGYCFNGGWGLRFDNSAAWEKAKTASHLWVSHYHGDHFHPPTLKKLLQINPGIIVIGNNSYNFQLDEGLRNIGFQQVISFKERKAIRIDKDTEIIRYPTTGIDNMLLVRSASGTILNYNDCSLPVYSRKKLSRRIGKIDLFLCNFNHAGKLLLYPYPGDEVVKKKLVDTYVLNLPLFDASYFLPFASYHYYRAPESTRQNSAMLGIKDLTGLSEKIIPAGIGDEIDFFDGNKSYNLTANSTTGENSFTLVTRVDGVDITAIQDAAKNYCKRLRRHYFFATSFMPRLIIRISDLEKTVILSPSKGLIDSDDSPEPHIIAHSKALHCWFSDKFGTDSFVVGAHFDINHANKIPLKWQIVLGLLIDNKLDLKSVLKMLFSAKGLRFLWNRREEISGILFSFRISAEYQKD